MYEIDLDQNESIIRSNKHYHAPGACTQGTCQWNAGRWVIADSWSASAITALSLCLMWRSRLWCAAVNLFLWHYSALLRGLRIHLPPLDCTIHVSSSFKVRSTWDTNSRLVAVPCSALASDYGCPVSATSRCAAWVTGLHYNLDYSLGQS